MANVKKNSLLTAKYAGKRSAQLVQVSAETVSVSVMAIALTIH